MIGTIRFEVNELRHRLCGYQGKMALIEVDHTGVSILCGGEVVFSQEYGGDDGVYRCRSRRRCIEAERPSSCFPQRWRRTLDPINAEDPPDPSSARVAGFREDDDDPNT